MELSGNNLLAYLNGRPPQCSMSEETRNWIQGCICNPLLSFAEHHLPLFVCALLVPGYILTWAIRQYLKVREIDRVHKGELDTVCFWAIYCIAWAFSSPTHGELLIWRISSVVITAISIYILLGFLLGICLAGVDLEKFGEIVFLFLPCILYNLCIT